MKKPLFICFEGLDGCGKSTQAKLLAEKIDGFYTREPSDFPIGKMIRERLKNQEIDISHETFQIMYAADRGDHYAGEIFPNIRQNKHVIIDRYFFSSLALGSSQGVDFEWLNEINKYFPIPDILFYIDTPIDLCLDRLKEKTADYSMELFEKRETLVNAHKSYQKIVNTYSRICSIHPDYSNENRIYVIDGKKTIEDIHEEIVNLI